jgi:hypothetical protein
MKKPAWRWLIPLFTSSLIFVNHYCRDSVGSLEKQLENEGLSRNQSASQLIFVF